MNETENKKTGWLPIAGGIALVIVLFIIVKLIFAGLESMGLPQVLSEDDPGGERPPAQSQQAEAAGPAFCPYCGEEMTDSFRWGQFCPFCGEKVEQ